MTPNSVCGKTKRRNSEKRKERSRDAARCRRTKEAEIFFQLSNLLPVSQKMSAQLDKASVVRLTVAYLKAQEGLKKLKSGSILDSGQMLDHSFLKALEGFIMILSRDGDMVFLSENVDKHLGLSQIDLIGHSIYDFCHPSDRDEIQKMLTAKNSSISLTVPLSFFVRMKCTLTSKGKNVNLRSASYKVIKYSGSVVTDKKMKKEPNEIELHSCDYCLICIGEPIPHPANIEILLDKRTYLSRHTMDMKFTYVDEKMSTVLDYAEEELLGKSAYQFLHGADGKSVERSFHTLIEKGQCETDCYRFLAKNGGYVWILTQATVIYGNEGNHKPRCIVCVNYVLSELENPNEVLSEHQLTKEVLPALLFPDKEEVSSTVKLPLSKNVKLPVPPSATLATLSSEEDEFTLSIPLPSTNTIFTPLTEDMNKGFLMFVDDNSGLTVLDDDNPEDLTHLAPTAGDVCIPLEVPSFQSDMFADVVFSDSFGEPSLMTEVASNTLEDNVLPGDNLPLSRDPFLSYQDDHNGSLGDSDGLADSPLTRSQSCRSSEACSSTGSPPQLEICDKMQGSPQSSTTALGITFAPSILTDESSDMDLEMSDLEFRAPYIPMGIGDVLPLLNPADQLWNQAIEESALGITRGQFSEDKGPPSITVAPNKLSSAAVKSNLARLLQSSSYKKQNKRAVPNQGKVLKDRGKQLKSVETASGIKSNDCAGRRKIGLSLSDQLDTDRGPSRSEIEFLLTSGFEVGKRRKLNDPEPLHMSPDVNIQSPSAKQSWCIPLPSEAGLPLHNSSSGKTLKLGISSNDKYKRKPLPLSHKRMCNDASSRSRATTERLNKRTRLGNVLCDNDISGVQMATSKEDRKHEKQKDPMSNSVLLNLLISGQDVSHGYSCYSPKDDTCAKSIKSPSQLLKEPRSFNRYSSSDLLNPEGVTIPSLLRITQLDAEVNAPIQSVQHLLQGAELMNALDSSVAPEETFL